MGLLSVEDDPKMVHSLAASKLQSNLEYKRLSKEGRSNYKMHANQPEFLQAKKSQAQASNLSYRQKLHDYTCDSQQLNVLHAKQAYKLQSDVSECLVEGTDAAHQRVLGLLSYYVSVWVSYSISQCGINIPVLDMPKASCVE